MSDTEVIALNIVEFLWNKILNLLPKTLVKSKTNYSFQASKRRIKEGLSVKIPDIKEQTRAFDSLVSKIMLMIFWICKSQTTYFSIFTSLQK